MKIHLSFLKTRLLALMLFFAGCLAFGQTTLAYFPLNTNQVPTVNLVSANVNLSSSTTFDSNAVYYNESSDNILLSANTTARSNLYITFNTRGSFPWYSLFADVIVEYRTTSSGAFTEIESVRIGESLANRTVNLPVGVNNQSNLEIRIRVNSGWWGDDKVWINDLKLMEKTANIMVYTAANTLIPHTSAASMIYTTDFGTVEPTDPRPVHTFRVRNYNGTSGSILNVTSIVVEGSHAADFTVTPTSISNISNVTTINDNSSNFKTFTVTFNPQGDGVRTAEVKLYSNSSPNPYIFSVVGVGASCSLVSKAHRENTAGIGGSNILTLQSNYNTTDDLIGGVAYGTGSNYNTFNTRLYPNGNLYTSPSQSLYARNVEKTFTFGGASGVDISELKEVSIEFNLAAFTVGDNNGVSNDAYVYLDVYNPNSSNWSREMTLKGADTYWIPFLGTRSNYYRYDFSGGSPFETIYDGNNSPNQSENTGSTKYKKFKLNIPTTSGIENLRFRIVAKTDGSNKLWLIDDVQIKSGTAVYKLYNTSGQWRNSDGTETTPTANTPPTTNQKAVIQGNYTVPTDNLSICECEIETGGNLNIPANRVLTVKNKITNLGDGTNFVVASDGNLIQVEDGAVNSGKILVHRNSPMKKNNYTYWSSPVSGQNLWGFSPGTSTGRFYWYNEADNKFYTNGLNSSSEFAPGKGYAIMAPSNYSATDLTTFDGKFTGVPNNGTKNTDNTDLVFPLQLSSGTNKGFNLIGNPYPSNIDFEKLYALNSTKIYNTAYFWTNVDPNRPGSTNGNGSAYSGNAYAIYTGTGGVPGTSTTATSATPTQYIKVGQGFIVKAREGQNGQNLIFNNSIRTATGTSHFFSKENQPSKDRFWLTLTTPADNVNTILIGYIPNASNGFERDYDAPLMSVASDSFYSLLDTNKLAIQGRSYPLDTEDVVPLGTKHYESGSYTLSLGDHEGIFASGQVIYLKDKETGIITDLTAGSYTFTSEPGEFTNRFEIMYKPGAATLAIQNPVKESLFVYRSGNDFVIKSDDANITGVEAYDMSGRMIRKLSANSREVQLPEYIFSNGVYILKIWHGDQVSTRKIRK